MMPVEKPAHWVEVETVFVRSQIPCPPTPLPLALSLNCQWTSPSRAASLSAVPPADGHVLHCLQAAFARACQSHPLQGTWAVDQSLPAEWPGWPLAAQLAGLAGSARGAELVQDAVRLTTLLHQVAVATGAEHSAHLQAQLLTDLQVFLDRLPASRQRASPLTTVSNGPAMLPGQSARQEAGEQPGRHVGAPRYSTRQAPTAGSPSQRLGKAPAGAVAAPPAVAPRPANPGANPVLAAAQTAHQKQHRVLASLIPPLGAARAASAAAGPAVPPVPAAQRHPQQVAPTPAGAAPAPRVRPLPLAVVPRGVSSAAAQQAAAGPASGLPSAATAALPAPDPRVSGASVPPLTVREDNHMSHASGTRPRLP